MNDSKNNNDGILDNDDFDFDKNQNPNNEELTLYKTFPNKALAIELAVLLNEKTIPFSIIENAYEVDISFSGNNPSNVQILIKEGDFKFVNDLLEEQAETQIANIDKDHYLFAFSDSELIQLIKRKDEWSSFDFTLAKSILKQRGKSLSDTEMLALIDERKNELKVSTNETNPQIVLGYFIAFLGGILGIMIGHFLMTSKRISTNGKKVYTYSENERKHGKNIRLIGVIFLVIWVALWFTTKFDYLAGF